MNGGAVLWAETPDDDGEESGETAGHGAIDDSFAVRRLRRWIKGMFGGKQTPKEEPPKDEPQR